MNFSVTKWHTVQRTTRSQTVWCCVMLDGFSTVVTACSVNQLMGVLETFWLDMWIISEGIRTAIYMLYTYLYMFSTCRQASRCELNKKLRYIKKTRVGESIGQEQKLFYEEDRNFGKGGIRESVFHFDLVQNSQIELQESQNCVHHYPLNGPKGEVWKM